MVRRAEGPSGVEVIEVAASSPIQALAKTGHGSTSHTLLPEVLFGEGGRVFLDCPGLVDTRASSVNVGNVVNVSACLGAASQLAIIFVVEHSTIVASRSTGATKLFLALLEILGGAKALRAHAGAILLAVSQSPDGADPVAARALLNGATSSLGLEAAEVFEGIISRAVLFSPLDDGPDAWTSRDAFVALLDKLERIEEPGDMQVFKPALSAEDEKEMRRVAEALRDKAQAGLEASDYGAVTAALASLGRLRRVNHSTVDLICRKALARFNDHVDHLLAAEAQFLILEDRFDDADAVIRRAFTLVGALEAETSSAARASLDLDRLRTKFTDLEVLASHRRLEAARMEQLHESAKSKDEKVASLMGELESVKAKQAAQDKELAELREELVGGAERAIEEARAIDAAFTERIRVLDERAAMPGIGGADKLEMDAQIGALRREMEEQKMLAAREAKVKQEKLQATINKREAAIRARQQEEKDMLARIADAKQAAADRAARQTAEEARARTVKEQADKAADARKAAAAAAQAADRKREAQKKKASDLAQQRGNEEARCSTTSIKPSQTWRQRRAQ